MSYGSLGGRGVRHSQQDSTCASTVRKGDGGVAAELGALGEFRASGGGAGEAAEEASELARGGEGGVFLEDEGADFFGVGFGEGRDGRGGQGDGAAGSPVRQKWQWPQFSSSSDSPK